MAKLHILLLTLILGSAHCAAANTLVQLETSQGNIVVELEDEKAPASVENFLRYVRDGFYDGTIFHRVMKDFVIQGGGYTEELRKKGGLRAPVMNEADNGLSNVKGSLAMARTSDPHSAIAQFYINVADNGQTLDHSGKSRRGWGYAVFGRVVYGWENVEKIRMAPTNDRMGLRNVPVRNSVINKAAEITPQQFEELLKKTGEQ